MGYDLHITRAEDWSESDRDPITAEEWLAVVAEDSELRIFARNGPYFAVWSGTDEFAESWLDWSDGRIYTKSPRRAELAKMLELAAKLGAKVQGDDGEVYARVEDLPGEEETARSPSRRRWKFW